MKLVYWIAPCLTDGKCYNVRAKTRKVVLDEVVERDQCNTYGSPQKVEVTYKDAFDLVASCLGEGGIE